MIICTKNIKFVIINNIVLKLFLGKDNCNYAVEIGRNQMKFKLIGIQGSNILDGDKTFTLGIFKFKRLA